MLSGKVIIKNYRENDKPRIADELELSHPSKYGCIYLPNKVSSFNRYFGAGLRFPFSHSVIVEGSTSSRLPIILVVIPLQYL